MATPQATAEELAKGIQALISDAQNDTRIAELFTKKVDESQLEFVTKPDLLKDRKELIPIKTGTFLDNIFLNEDDKPLGGIPSVSNSILTGLPSSGKSLLIMELALRLSESGHKVVFATSEDIWRTESARFDLESRMKIMKDKLKLDRPWDVNENLFVLDVVAHAELRDWTNFISTYRTVTEMKKATIFLCDSITLLEDVRGSIKYRLNEMCRYNQKHGITAIFVSQRSVEETDSFALSGGLALSHIADCVFELDYKKASSWDSSLKQDTGCKQGEIVNFFRILKCRLCKVDMHYFAYSITPDGFVRLNPKIV